MSRAELSVIGCQLEEIRPDEKSALIAWETVNLDGHRTGTFDWKGWRDVAERCGFVPSERWPWWKRSMPIESLN